MNATPDMIVDTYPQAMTVKQFKELVAKWPEKDFSGNDTGVWLHLSTVDKYNGGSSELCRVEFIGLDHMLLTPLSEYRSNPLVPTKAERERDANCQQSKRLQVNVLVSLFRGKRRDLPKP